MAYGAIAAPKLTEELPTFSYPLPSGEELVTFPVHGEADAAVMDYLCGIFMTELEDGRTYPQESMTAEGFRSYFFNSTTIVAVVIDRDTVEKGVKPASISEAIAGRSVEDAIGGCYYVKPNYPGRSSHLCNAGFLVPPAQRGKKIGSALAKSFLEYGPRLGYRGSVFNLVYKNNAASIKLWDTLGFQRVGLIPGAGRLRTADGKGEEYVDAIVVHKSFV